VSQLLYPKTGTRKMMMQEKIILRVVAKALIPFILLFALYVQFHGDFGPGGGFQAGVIFAAGLILYGLIFGPMALAESVKPRWIEIGIALGVLIYGGVGIDTFIRHGHFLSYGTLDHHDPVHGQHLGILLVELGVGITVASVMTGIYLLFAGRGRRRHGGSLRR
jgi:multicomponent Na+:H+ antiporter subunit B